MTERATVDLYPLASEEETIREHESAAAAVASEPVGVCVSGGGSRSLSACMGQLRALRELGLLERTRYLSGVSGGAWALTLFSYLPGDVSDEEFLGGVVSDPEDLYWHPLIGGKKEEPENLGYLPPRNMGQVPPRLGFMDDVEILLELKKKYGYPDHELWCRLVGKVVFEPFGLSLFDEDPASPAYGQPTRFYSYTADYVRSHVLGHNPALTLDDFHCVEHPRPFLIVNTSLFPSDAPGAELLPVESTSLGIGIRQAFPAAGKEGRDLGGGLAQPLGFGGVDQQPVAPCRCEVELPMRFAPADVAAMSGAGFASAIEERFSEFDGLLPRYPYWPVLNVGDPKNVATDYMFADGGNLENTGIMPLLARGVPTVIAFVNCQAKLEKRKTPGGGEVIVVDEQLPPLFGFVPLGKAGTEYKPFSDGDVPEPYVQFAGDQVFPADELERLLEGLWRTRASGGPALHLSRVTTVANPKFDVAAYPVTVLWVYLDKVEKWWKRLAWWLRARLNLDVLGFRMFPHYDSIMQFKLEAPQINLLAQMTCWSVLQDEFPVLDGMTSAELFRSLYAPPEASADSSSPSPAAATSGDSASEGR